MFGNTLGHYRIGEQLGRGGMGEVYLADDLNLNRRVALKFLPDAFTGDPERMARFEREAKLLASLNHPNIAAIHGLEQAEGKRFLVLELVEGETLAQRLSKGSLPIDEALGICKQIADALEAAHEKGVIHRDLKPANVMITEGDKVKILDFGLAKALSDETRSIDSSHSPTITEAMTQPGVILGTAAYMSPEQAKGKAVDKRSDIWAFGCILYECLTGRRAFEGETVTETLAAVLTSKPDWARVPDKARLLLESCLEKNPARRLRDIGDAWRLLQDIPGSASTKHPWFAWSLAALAVLFAIVLGFVVLGRKAPLESGQMRLQINYPDGAVPGPMEAFALSPDGRQLAFDAIGSDGVQRLWLRALDSPEARPLLGTESNIGITLFWSPDSRFVGFEADRKLKTIDVSGGAVKTVCDLSGTTVGGSWSPHGEIIFGYWGAAQGLMRVSAAGGVASPLTKLDPARQEKMHSWPAFLADGRHFLHLCLSNVEENTGVYIGSLDNKPGETGSRQLLSTNFAAAYVLPQNSSPGRLLFLRNQTLMAQSFDDRLLEPIGKPIPVAEQVGNTLNTGLFSASANGVLAYRKRNLYRLAWYDRRGRVLDTLGEPGNYRGVALSPDGTLAAVSWQNPALVSLFYDLYLTNLVTGKNTQLTFGKANSISPSWLPDGSRIIFILDRNDRQSICRKLTSGTKQEEVLLKDVVAYHTSVSSDGRFLLYGAADATKTAGDLWMLPLEGDRKPAPFLNTEFSEAQGRFSPDMRWIAYVSDESGKNEIYIRAISKTAAGTSWQTGGQWAVSKGGGTAPRWRKDGKELYYRALDGKVMAVEVTADSVFKSGTPESLFQAPIVGMERFSVFGFGGWDAAPDGQRFLLMTPAAENPTPTPFNVVLNWTSALKQ